VAIAFSDPKTGIRLSLSVEEIERLRDVLDEVVGRSG
jgi:hypothetical protein